MKNFRGYLGATLTMKGKTWDNFPVAKETFERIKKDPRYKNWKPKGAVALTPSEELKLAEAGAGKALGEELQFKAAVAYNI